MLDHGRHSNLGSYHAPDSICGDSCRVQLCGCQRALRSDHRQVGTVSGATNQRDRANLSSTRAGGCEGSHEVSRYSDTAASNTHQATERRTATLEGAEQSRDSEASQFGEVKSGTIVSRIESSKGWRRSASAGVAAEHERRKYRGSARRELQRGPCYRRQPHDSSRVAGWRRPAAGCGSVHGSKRGYVKRIRRPWNQAQRFV